MKTPTRSLRVIERQIERARRDRSMVVLHPDTVEWLLKLVDVKTELLRMFRRGARP